MTRFHRFAAAVLLAATASALVPGPARAQDIGSNLESLARENGELYVGPVFRGLGNALNTGFLRTPDPHDRFGFDIGVRVMGAIVPDEDLSFAAIPPQQIEATFGGMTRTYQNPYAPRGGSLQTPTAVGEGDGVVLEPTGQFRQDLITAGENPDDFNVPFPEGFDVPGIPFAVIQVGLGIGFGTEISARFIPSTEVNEDVGSVSALGFGVAHSLSQHFPGPAPVDVAVFGGYQGFDVGDFLEATTTTFGASVGKGLGPLSIYGLAQVESPSVDLSYTVENPENNPALPDDGEPIAFSPDLGTNTRLGVGVNLDLIILQIGAEYSSGDYDAVTARVGFSFR